MSVPDLYTGEVDLKQGAQIKITIFKDIILRPRSLSFKNFVALTYEFQGMLIIVIFWIDGV